MFGGICEWKKVGRKRRKLPWSRVAGERAEGETEFLLVHVYSLHYRYDDTAAE